MKKPILWNFYNFILGLLFLIVLYVFAIAPIILEWNDEKIISISSLYRPLWGFLILGILKIILDPSKQSMRMLLRRAHTWLYLILVLIFSSLFGLGLFTHIYFDDIFHFWNGNRFLESFSKNLLEYITLFAVCGIIGAYYYLKQCNFTPASISYYTLSLSGSIIFIYALSPVVLLLTSQVAFMLFILVASTHLAFLYYKNVSGSPRTYRRILLVSSIAIYLIIITLLLIKCYLPRNYDDFPFFIQSLSSLLRGDLMLVTWLFDSSGAGLSYIGDHFSPFLLLLLPFFYLWPGPEILVIIQALAVALAIIPLYYLCRDKFPREPRLVLALCLVYLLTPWILKGFFFDFHQDAFKPFFIFLSFLALERKRWWLYSFSLLALLSIKEDAFFIPIFFGIYAMIFNKEYKVGIFSILSGFVWAGLVMGYIMPQFYPDEAVYRHVANRYGKLGSTHLEIIQQILFSPIETFWIIFDTSAFHTFLYLFLPLAFLPFLSLRGIIIFAPFIGQMILSSWYYTRTIYFYYPFAVFPFLLIASILSLGSIQKYFNRQWPKLGSWLAIYLISATILFHFFYRTHIEPNRSWHDYYYLHEAPLSYRFNPSFYSMNERNREAHQFITEKVPPDASLSTQVRYAAHLANRPIIRMFPNLKNVEYVFLDFYEPPFAMNYGKMRHKILGFIKRKDFGIIDVKNGFILAKKGAQHNQYQKSVRKDLWQFEAEVMPKENIGKIVLDPKCSNGRALFAEPKKDRFGYLIHELRLPMDPGHYKVFFRIKAIGRNPNDKILVIKVTSDRSLPSHQEKVIQLKELKEMNVYQTFDSEFSLEESRTVEFIVIYTSQAKIWIDQFYVEEIDSLSQE